MKSFLTMLTADKNEVARNNLGLVHSCCRRFAGKGIEYEELFSAGCLGLSRAINNFDESRGLRFSTYAFPVILGEIKRLFRDGGSVRVSRSLRELALKISRLNDQSAIQNGSELTVSELSKMLGEPEELIIEAIGSAQIPLSLTVEPGEDESRHLDIPVDDIQYEISERLSLYSAIDRLEEQDKKLIRLRYFNNKTQVQTARALNMTQVQVSRREKKILSFIRGIL